MKRLISIGLTALFLFASPVMAVDALWILDIMFDYKSMTIYYAVVDDASQHIDILSQCPLGWTWKAGEYEQVGMGQYKAKALTEDGFAVTQHGGPCIGTPNESIPSPDMEKLWI